MNHSIDRDGPGERDGGDALNPVPHEKLASFISEYRGAWNKPLSRIDGTATIGDFVSIVCELVDRRATDRTAPAKEAAAVTDERLAQFTDGVVALSTISIDELESIARELQSRRSSPVREGDLGQATPKTASHPSRAASQGATTFARELENLILISVSTPVGEMIEAMEREIEELRNDD